MGREVALWAYLSAKNGSESSRKRPGESDLKRRQKFLQKKGDMYIERLIV